MNDHNIVRLYLFGSYVRWSEKSSSDIDLLYETGDKKIWFSQFLDIKTQLQKYLGKNIDMVDRKYLNKYYAPYIEKEKERVL